MKVKFIKDHVSGLGKDSVVKLENAHAKRLIEEGFVVEVDDKTAYKRVDSHVADPGKQARGKKQKEADEKLAKAKIIRAQKHKQP